MEARSTSRSAHVARRRARSLSRFPPPTPGSDEFETPRSRFVNKARGSGQVLFAGSGEVSLDDLADEFLRARAESEEDDVVSVRRGRQERRMSLHSGNSGSGSRYFEIMLLSLLIGVAIGKVWEFKFQGNEKLNLSRDPCLIIFEIHKM